MVDRPDSKFEQYHLQISEFKNEWSYVFSASIRLHGVYMAALCLF